MSNNVNVITHKDIEKIIKEIEEEKGVKLFNNEEIKKRPNYTVDEMPDKIGEFLLKPLSEKDLKETAELARRLIEDID